MMELGAPDRKDLNAHAAEGEAPGLTDAQGRPIVLPNIDRAISTPETPAIGQAGAAGLGKDPNLPDEVEIKLPSPEFGGNA